MSPTPTPTPTSGGPPPNHTYSTLTSPASTPSTQAIGKFFDRFYRISDTPNVHEEYVDCFTEGATVVVASTRVEGREGILGMRTGLWERTAELLHTPIKIFPFGEAGKEVMIYGTVEQVLKDGRKVHLDWAARAEMVMVDGKEGEGEWKMGFYQVYLDTGASQQAEPSRL